MNLFKNLIVLGPLVYAVHHFEEHVIFNFIEWTEGYLYLSNVAVDSVADIEQHIAIATSFSRVEFSH